MYSIYEKLIKERGITTYRVAKDTGISESFFYSWKIGRTNPSYEYLDKLANYFGVSIEYLKTGTYKEKDYYLNDETADIAQKIFDNRKLRLLFEAAQDASPEDLDVVHTMLVALKNKGM